MKLTESEIRDVIKYLVVGNPALCRQKRGRCKIAVKVVDIFGNDTMKIIEVTI